MSNEPDEPQDDAYTPHAETRRSLIRRVVAMSVVTAIALPAAWSYDHRDNGAEQQLASPPSTAAVPLASASSAAAAPEPPPATTTTAAPAELPEIETAEDLARVTGRPLPDTGDEDLPEITAPSQSSRSQDDEDDSGSDESAVATAASGSDAGATAPAPAADARSGSTPDPEPAPTTAVPASPTPSPPPDTTAPAPTPAAPSSREEHVRQLIRDTFPADQHGTALKVAERESGFDAGAVSPSGCCVGIFQIHYTANQSLVNGLGYDRDDLFDPAANVAVARALWQRSGWRPWSQTAY